MKIDVFIRTTSEELANPLRKAMLEVTVARWNLEPVKVQLLHDYPIREGRQFAENSAKSDPYIFTDSDVLIVGKDWVTQGMDVLLSDSGHGFGAVSTLSLVETENVARPNSEAPIYAMHWVGAPMWIRKGLLRFDECTHCRDKVPFNSSGEHQVGDLRFGCSKPIVPEMTIGSECGVIFDYLKAKGYAEGLFNPSLKLRHNHLGSGFSSNPNLHWGY